MRSTHWIYTLDRHLLGVSDIVFTPDPMESEERSYTLKEAKDLLRHIKEQRLDYRDFPPYVESSHSTIATANEESMWQSSTTVLPQWQYFDELPDRSKFLLLFHILNEHTFKTTVFNLLHLIKASDHPQMNASFLCLGEHIKHIYDTSISHLGETNTNISTNNTTKSTTKSTSCSTRGRASNSNKTSAAVNTNTNTTPLIELDPYFTWHPQASEYLLLNIATPSHCGGVSRFPGPGDIAKLQLMGSSLVRE